MDPSEVDSMVEELKVIGIYTVAPMPQKKLSIQLLAEEIYWSVPIIEVRSVGVRSHKCDANEHSNIPSTWSCKCRYDALDQKFLRVSREAQALFGYSDQECLELCDPDNSQIPDSIAELFTTLIHKDDYELMCQSFIEAILDIDGRSLPRKIRCMNQKDSSMTRCIVRLRISKSDNFTSNEWNHVANWCFFPLI
jgi:hypothetical protein